MTRVLRNFRKSDGFIRLPLASLVDEAKLISIGFGCTVVSIVQLPLRRSWALEIMVGWCQHDMRLERRAKFSRVELRAILIGIVIIAGDLPKNIWRSRTCRWSTGGHGSVRSRPNITARKTRSDFCPC